VSRPTDEDRCELCGALDECGRWDGGRCERRPAGHSVAEAVRVAKARQARHWRKPVIDPEDSNLTDKRNLALLIPILAFSAWEIIAMFVKVPILRPLATLSDYIQWFNEWVPFHIGDSFTSIVILLLWIHLVLRVI
jgi:hypothetical protein